MCACVCKLGGFFPPLSFVLHDNHMFFASAFVALVFPLKVFCYSAYFAGLINGFRASGLFES